MSWLGDLIKPREKVIPRSLSDEDFRKAVHTAGKPVIADFHSPSCGPCKRLVPILIDVATDYADQVEVVAVDVRNAPKTTRRFSIRATPTVVIFDGGKEVGRFTGYRPKKWFQEMIAKEFGEA
jgi:thioredoxin 1